MRRKMGGRGADRFRNYGDVLQRHEKEVRLKKILRVFSFVFVIMIVVMLIVIVVRIERRIDKKEKNATSQVEPRYRK
jgi:fucose permease